MNFKTKLTAFFTKLLPGTEKDGVLSQYQKMILDTAPVIPYTGGTLGHESVVGVTDSTLPVDYATPGYVGKMMMEEAMEKEIKKPVITVETIVNAVENKYPKAVVELAKILRDMKVQYSVHASTFSAKLFEAQDSLGLTSNEVSKIMEEIISQKDVIIDTTQVSIDIINKPKVI